MHLLGRALILKKLSIQARKIALNAKQVSTCVRGSSARFFRRARKVGQHEQKRISTPLLPIKRVPRPAPIPVYVCICVCACVLSRRNGRENIIVCATWTSIVRISLVQTRVNFERADELLTLRAEGGLHPRPRYNSLPRFQKRDGNQRIIRILSREEPVIFHFLSFHFVTTNYSRSWIMLNQN